MISECSSLMTFTKNYRRSEAEVLLVTSDAKVFVRVYVFLVIFSALPPIHAKFRWIVANTLIWKRAKSVCERTLAWFSRFIKNLELMGTFHRCPCGKEPTLARDSVASTFKAWRLLSRIYRWMWNLGSESSECYGNLGTFEVMDQYLR